MSDIDLDGIPRWERDHVQAYLDKWTRRWGPEGAAKLYAKAQRLTAMPDSDLLWTCFLVNECSLSHHP